MAGGNAHQRAKERAAKARMLGQVSEAVMAKLNQAEMVPATIQTKKLSSRLFDFIEHPLVLTSLFALGGIVGALIYTPFLILCAFCILLGLHRARVVSDQPLKLQIPIYAVLAVLLSGGGYLLYGALHAALDRVQTDFAKKIAMFINQKEPTPSSTLPAQLVRGVIDVRLFSKKQGLITPYWFVASPGGCVMFPVKAALYITVTNNKPGRVMIAGYTVAARGKKRDQWDELIRLEPRNGFMVWVQTKSGGLPQVGRTVALYSSTSIQMDEGIKDIEELDFPHAAQLQEDMLNTVLDGRYIQPGDTVGGWAFFDYPNAWDVAEDLQLNLTDATGETYSSVAPYDKNAKIPTSAGLTSRTFTVVALRDLSDCTKKSAKDVH